MTDYHVPVLLHEVIEYLQPKAGKKYIDCTFGGGGHSRMLLEKGASVLGIDHDQDAIDHAATIRKEFPQLQVVKGNFSNLSTIAQEHNSAQVDGILMDLGASSWQFDEASRGFSFQHEAELDMRMDKSLQVKAKDLLAVLSERELTQLFRLYGDEPHAKQIAKAIVHQRKTKPLVTTLQLADLISKVYRGRQGKLHPATKVFQALRIVINDELNNLTQVLPQTLSLLIPGGVLAVISFHEGEDRVVKKFMKQNDQIQIQVLTNKPITPTQQELAANIRSRSAKLRVAQKL